MRILRHDLEIVDYQTITVPNDGDLMSVAKSRTHENIRIDLWSLDLEYGQARTFGLYIVGTGNPMPEELRDSNNTRYRRDEARHSPGYVHDVYIQPENPEPWRRFLGTVVTPINLVWHIFEGPVQ